MKLETKIKKGNDQPDLQEVPEITFEDLIKSGLRNNPEWLKISEVHGTKAEALLSKLDYQNNQDKSVEDIYEEQVKEMD